MTDRVKWAWTSWEDEVILRHLQRRLAGDPTLIAALQPTVEYVEERLLRAVERISNGPDERRRA